MEGVAVTQLVLKGKAMNKIPYRLIALSRKGLIIMLMMTFVIMGAVPAPAQIR
jgi:hypothetical protein